MVHFRELSAVSGAIKNVKPLFFLLAAAGTLSAAPAANDLLAQAHKALGGKAPEVTSLVAAGTHRVTMGPGKDADVSTRELTLSFRLPNQYLKEETMDMMGHPGPTLLEGFDGERGWNDTRQGPSGGMIFIRTMGDNDPQARAKVAQITMARYLLAFTLTAQPDFPVQFTYAGQAEAPDGKADVLDGTGPNDFRIRLYLDAQSHLPLMLSYQGAEQRVMINRRIGPGGPPPDPEKMKKELGDLPKPKMVEYQVRPSEYKKVNGRLLPHVLTWTVAGNVAEEIEVKKFTLNSTLSPEIFRKK
jgi:hypothetical protein